MKPVEVGDIDHQPGVARDATRPSPGQPRNLPNRQPGASQRRRRASRKDGASNSAASRTRKWPPRCTASPCKRAGNGSPTPAWKRSPNDTAAGNSRRTAVQVVLGSAIARELGRSRTRGAIGLRAQPRPARRRRRVLPRRADLDRRRRHAIVRLDVRFRDLGEGGRDRPDVRQGDVHHGDRSRRRRRSRLGNSKTSTPITTRRPPFRPRSRPTTSPTSARATSSSSPASSS